MMIKKKKDSFNDYSVELSWGQLNAIYQALEQDHADPLADELFAELGWYLQNVPGPGEDEEEYKEARQAEKAATEGGTEPGGPDQELLGTEVKGPPEDEEPGAAGGPDGAKSPSPIQKPEAEEADRFLERPPEREPAMV